MINCSVTKYPVVMFVETEELEDEDLDGEFEDVLKDLDDLLKEDHGYMVPDGKDIADTAYLAWKAEGDTSIEELGDIAEAQRIDLTYAKIGAAMDYLAESGIVEGGITEYDVGDSQQFRDPDPGMIRRVIAPVVGQPVIEDHHLAFETVGRIQQAYENTNEDEKTAGLYSRHDADPNLDSEELRKDMGF
jgi:hypothetical protein